MNKRIGILGGTFSPPHLGHKLLAQHALEEMQLDQLFLMPCHIPPHKDSTLPTQHRINMLRLLFADMPGIRFDFREILKDTLSFTYLSIREWQREYPNTSLFFIMGCDSFASFTTWENWQEILSACNLIIAPRDKLNYQSLTTQVGEENRHKLHLLSKHIPDISSTEIRQAGENTEYITQVCSEAVAKYYLQHCVS